MEPCFFLAIKCYFYFKVKIILKMYRKQDQDVFPCSILIFTFFYMLTDSFLICALQLGKRSFYCVSDEN